MNTVHKINYNARETDIIKRLAKGYSREEIYTRYGYSTWKSLDSFMRKRGYYFVDGNYEKPKEIKEHLLKDLNADIPSKAVMIARQFENAGTLSDPVQIAQKFGFHDSMEMNAYMRDNGLYYNSRSQTYETRISTIKFLSSDNTHHQAISTSNISDFKAVSSEEGLQKFLPLLNFLLDNKEQLVHLISSNQQRKIPQYLIPGTTKVKSISMSDMLLRILDDFTRSMNLSIKEVCEAAIIEFLCNYGYKDEIKLMLTQK